MAALQRLVTFIIWGNGYCVSENILETISKDFTVERIVRVDNYHIKNTINFVYKYDLINPIHLRGKTSYLSHFSEPIFVVLCSESNPHLTVSDNPGSLVVSERVADVKAKCRGEFNRKEKNGMPSHDHVLHATDSEADALRLFVYFDPTFRRICKGRLLYGDHIPALIDIRNGLDGMRQINAQVTIKIESLLCNIVDVGRVSIFDTPHYKSCNGQYTDYQSYTSMHRGQGHKCYYSSTKFNQLILSFDAAVYDPISVVKIGGAYVITDGLHRACILAQNNKSEVLCNVVS